MIKEFFKQLLFYPIYNLLIVIYALLPGHDFGIAVIVLTLVIRGAMWPLVKKQLHHQKAMRELAPEVKKLKKKAKGDKEKEAMLMMELYKEKEVNPFSSLGVTFLQFPFLIALFFVLRDITANTGDIANATYGFLQNFDFINNLVTNPTLFNTVAFNGLVDLAETSVFLALLAGLAQFLQARQLTPQNTSDQDSTAKLGNNLALVFPVVTVIFAMQFPGALALYWATASFLGFIQQYIILRQDAEEMSDTVKVKSKQTKSKKSKKGGKK